MRRVAVSGEVVGRNSALDGHLLGEPVDLLRTERVLSPGFEPIKSALCIQDLPQADLRLFFMALTTVVFAPFGIWTTIHRLDRSIGISRSFE